MLASTPYLSATKNVFFTFYYCIIFSFKFSDGNCKCQVSDVLKVLPCIVLSVHKTLILTFFRSKRRRLKETGLNWHKCCKLNKTKMLSAKISREFEKKRNLLFINNVMCRLFQISISLFQISTSRPESLFKLIVLSSLVYPYVELDNEQNVMNRPLSC